jgi:hypothetical protein
MTYTSAWMDEDLAMLAKTASKFFETNLVAARHKHEAQRHIDREV